jgi:hypothetical protein
MMSFLTYITGFFMNFEILLILTDYANYSSNLGTFWLKIEQFWPFDFFFLVMAAILDTGQR